MHHHNLYDKKGYPFHIGDVLKVFHYIAALRREKRYMYKQVHGMKRIGKDSWVFIIKHLTSGDKPYYLSADGRRMMDYEIVQGAGMADHRTREKK